MELVTLLSFEDELEKISGARLDAAKAFASSVAKRPAAVGAALGGSLGGLSNVRSEMKKRDLEDFLGKNPEDTKKNRRSRLKRMALSTAASAGTGALLGHAGSKGVAALKGAGKKAIDSVAGKAENIVTKAGNELREVGTHAGKEAEKVVAKAGETLATVPSKSADRAVHAAKDKVTNLANKLNPFK